MCGWPLWVHLGSMAADSQGQVMLLCKASGRKRKSSWSLGVVWTQVLSSRQQMLEGGGKCLKENDYKVHLS